jgi:hypothetical protein
VGYSDYLDVALSFNKARLGNRPIVIVTSESDTKTHAVCEKYGVHCLVSAYATIGFPKGKIINDALSRIETDWILHLDADIILPPAIGALDLWHFDPDRLYYTKRWEVSGYWHLKHVLDKMRAGENVREKYRGVSGEDFAAYGYFQLFNRNATVLKDRAAIYPDNSQDAGWDDDDFCRKVYNPLLWWAMPQPDFEVFHMYHGALAGNWEGRKSPRLDALFAMTDAELFDASPGKDYVCITPCQYRGRVWKVGEHMEQKTPMKSKCFKPVVIT